MRTAWRMAFIGALAAALISTTAGVAFAKEVSTEKFAKALCGAYTDLGEATDAYNDAYAAVPTDPAGLQAAVQTAASDLVSQLGRLKARIKKVYPAVEDGKKVTKLFVVNFSDISSEVSSALKKFQSADPNSATFAADIAAYETAVTLLDTKTSDPFRKLKSQEVIVGLDDEKSCDDVVTIIGG